MTVLTAVFTAVLVLVTGYYAWQTNRLVDEMRKDRRERALPRLALDLRSEGVGFAPPSICNLGLGPAIDVDVTMTFVPRDARADLSGIQFVTRRWRSRLVAPGERPRFMPPTDAVGSPLSMDKISEVFSSVRLTGTCRSTVGDAVTVDEELDNLGELWELATSAWHIVDNDPATPIVDALDSIRKVLVKMLPKPSQAQRRRQLAEGKAAMDEYWASDEGKAEAARTAAELQRPDDVDLAGVEDPALAPGGRDQDPVDDDADGPVPVGRDGGPAHTEQALVAEAGKGLDARAAGDPETGGVAGPEGGHPLDRDDGPDDGPAHLGALGHLPQADDDLPGGLLDPGTGQGDDPAESP